MPQNLSLRLLKLFINQLHFNSYLRFCFYIGIFHNKTSVDESAAKSLIASFEAVYQPTTF